MAENITPILTRRRTGVSRNRTALQFLVVRLGTYSLSICQNLLRELCVYSVPSVALGY